MLAVISSCLAPSPQPGHDGLRTNIPTETRIAQTVQSVTSLERLGFDEIYLADNSAEAPSANIIAQLAPARVFHFAHFPYRNKGVAEAHLLLALLPRLPEAKPIMKLSGRYRASIDLCAKLGGADLAGLFSGEGRVENLSTRAYAVRDRDFFQRLLLGTLDELYATPWRVVGPRSLLSLLRRVVMPRSDNYPYSDPLCSLEISAARWLERHQIAVTRLEKIGVEGVIGSWINPAVQE
jgi:hypothetical protein